MSLDHDFILVSTAEHSPADYFQFIRTPHSVRVHDDLLRYIADSLKWIATVNPAKKNERGDGLNFYGPTAILVEGAATAAGVFRTWAQLFRLSPAELLLTGPWTSIEGDAASGHFAQLRFQRDAVVAAFEQIADDCSRVADSAGAYFVLHLGI